MASRCSRGTCVGSLYDYMSNRRASNTPTSFGIFRFFSLSTRPLTSCSFLGKLGQFDLSNILAGHNHKTNKSTGHVGLDNATISVIALSSRSRRTLLCARIMEGSGARETIFICVCKNKVAILFFYVFQRGSFRSIDRSNLRTRVSSLL